MNSSETDINKLRGAIENCDGASESMAETMQDNLNGQLTILKSQLEELAISFGDILMPPSARSYLPCNSSWTSSTVWMKVPGKRSSRSGFWRHPLVRCLLYWVRPYRPLAQRCGDSVLLQRVSGFSSPMWQCQRCVQQAGCGSGWSVRPGRSSSGGHRYAGGGFYEPLEHQRGVPYCHYRHLERHCSKVKGFCDQLTQRINGLGFDFKDVTEVLKTVWDGFCQVLAPLFEGAFQNISTISVSFWIPYWVCLMSFPMCSPATGAVHGKR